MKPRTTATKLSLTAPTAGRQSGAVLAGREDDRAGQVGLGRERWALQPGRGQLSWLGRPLARLQDSLPRVQKTLFQTERSLPILKKIVFWTEGKVPEARKRVFQGVSHLVTPQKRVLRLVATLPTPRKRVFQGVSHLVTPQKRVLRLVATLPTPRKRVFQGVPNLVTPQKRVLRLVATLPTPRKRVFQGRGTFPSLWKTIFSRMGSWFSPFGRCWAEVLRQRLGLGFAAQSPLPRVALSPRLPPGLHLSPHPPP
jgi:hypothetical protein